MALDETVFYRVLDKSIKKIVLQFWVLHFLIKDLLFHNKLAILFYLIDFETLHDFL